jgi:hypothetical protein
VDPARQAAYDVLAAVRTKDAYANLVLPDLLRERRITGRDAALATELTYGTSRAQDSMIASSGRCPRPTRRCSTRCASASTSCCARASPSTPP